MERVSKTYETGCKAVKNVSFTVQDGEFVFIVGKSGSGKSTLLKLLLKELEPTKGRIVVNDMDLRKMPRRYVPKYRRGLGVVFQDFRLLKDRNIYENIAFALRVTETPTKVIKKKVPAALSLVGLAQKYKSFPKELSGGEQQMLAIGRGMMSEPKLLLLDEPSLGLAPIIINQVFQLIQEIRDSGITILLVEQNARRALEICDKAYILENGVIKMEGSGEELLHSPEVMAAYLGEQIGAGEEA